MSLILLIAVAQRLVDANRDLLEKYDKTKEWTLSLINDSNITNAFVLSVSIFIVEFLNDRNLIR